MAELLVDSGKHRGRRVKLAPGATIVGREAGCPIRLATADVSRRHCRLTVAAGPNGETVVAEDLGSRNGTYVNGRPIDGPTPLGAGDALRIGPVQFLVPDPEAPSESEVVNWLVPPPAAGTVAADEPTQVDTPVPRFEPEPTGPSPAPPAPEVLEAAAVVRDRRAALAADSAA